MFRKTLLTLALILSGTSAWSGAWDVGAFDNDDALDWVFEVSETANIAAVRVALERVADSSGYVQVTSANRALAAAEVVAAMNGNPNPMLPEEISDWISKNGLKSSPELTSLARRAVTRISDAENSELAELWSESPEMRELWAAEMARLASRLE